VLIEEVATGKHLNHHAILVSIDRDGLLMNAELIMSIRMPFSLGFCCMQSLVFLFYCPILFLKLLHLNLQHFEHLSGYASQEMLRTVQKILPRGVLL